MKAIKICLLVTVSLATGRLPVLADDNLSALALSGQVVPGTTDTFFAYLDAPPVINNLGQVAFHANYVPPSGIWREGIWSNAGNDGGHFVVSAGDQVPGAA